MIVRRSARELFGTTALVGCALGVLLLAGQVAQLHRALGAHLPWRTLGLGLVALAEVLLPLSCLLGVGLAYGRWRGEGHLTALAALGVRPVHLLVPAFVVGATVSAVTGVFATRLGPRALAALAEAWDAAVVQSAHVGAGVVLPTGRVRGVSRPDGTPGEIWAVVTLGEGLAVLRAEGLEVGVAGATRLRDVVLDTGSMHARIGEVVLDDLPGPRRPGALRPPQTIPDDALPVDASPEWTFVRARRLALAVLAVPAAVLGALLGGTLGRSWALLGGAGAAGVLYWALRAGTLAVRDGRWPPTLGAWLPVFVLSALAVSVAWWGWGRFRA